MRSASRSPSLCNSRSGPVNDNDSSAPTVTMPMMTTTTRISSSVKPPLCGALELELSTAVRGVASATVAALLVAVLVVAGLGIQVPVADVRILALATFLAVGAEGVHVVFATMRAGIDVLVVIAPGVFQVTVLDVAALLPIADGGIGGLFDQRLQPLIRGWILEVVEPVHGQRGADGLDVLLGLGDSRFAHFADDTGHNDRGQQTDDDHDHHDFDEREAAEAGDGIRTS